MRGRFTYACYRKMDVMDCVASSPEEYVDIALELGKNQNYRNSIKEKILSANHVLYENLGAVRELEEFFIEITKKVRSGQHRVPTAGEG